MASLYAYPRHPVQIKLEEPKTDLNSGLPLSMANLVNRTIDELNNEIRRKHGTCLVSTNVLMIGESNSHGMHLCPYALMHLCPYAPMHLCTYAPMHLCLVSTNVLMIGESNSPGFESIYTAGDDEDKKWAKAQLSGAKERIVYLLPLTQETAATQFVKDTYYAGGSPIGAGKVPRPIPARAPALSKSQMSYAPAPAPNVFVSTSRVSSASAPAPAPAPNTYNVFIQVRKEELGSGFVYISAQEEYRDILFFLTHQSLYAVRTLFSPFIPNVCSGGCGDHPWRDGVVT
jgi:hypothetical protein